MASKSPFTEEHVAEYKFNLINNKLYVARKKDIVMEPQADGQVFGTTNSGQTTVLNPQVLYKYDIVAGYKKIESIDADPMSVIVSVPTGIFMYQSETGPRYGIPSQKIRMEENGNVSLYPIESASEGYQPYPIINVLVFEDEKLCTLWVHIRNIIRLEFVDGTVITNAKISEAKMGVVFTEDEETS